MGAWGVLAFDNDDACDWAHDLEAVKTFNVVEKAFTAVEGAGSYLEASDATSALAACEVVARASGGGGYQNSYTERVDTWVSKHRLKPSPKLIQRAHLVIEGVLGPKSELRELWEDSNSTKEWLDSVEDLRRRLGAGGESSSRPQQGPGPFSSFRRLFGLR